MAEEHVRTGCERIDLREQKEREIPPCTHCNRLREQAQEEPAELGRLLCHWGLLRGEISEAIEVNRLRLSGILERCPSMVVRGLGSSERHFFNGGTHYIFPLERGSISIADGDGRRRQLVHPGQVIELSEGAADVGALAASISILHDSNMRRRRIVDLCEPQLDYIDHVKVDQLFAPQWRHGPSAYLLDFPSGYSQEIHAHIHPHTRIGTALSGRGTLHFGSPDSEESTALEHGIVFALRAGTRHWFETSGESLRLAVVHPVTPTEGPSDHDHPVERGTFETLDDVHALLRRTDVSS